nr:MAG TPA: hypothetical protein [Caudoviricetes sp.]
MRFNPDANDARYVRFLRTNVHVYFSPWQEAAASLALQP